MGGLKQPEWSPSPVEHSGVGKKRRFARYTAMIPTDCWKRILCARSLHFRREFLAYSCILRAVELPFKLLETGN